MDEKKILNEGVYTIPSNCKVRTRKQGDNIILSVTKKINNIVTDDRCRDCKWFDTDYSDFNTTCFKTTVCLLKPRHTNNKYYKRQTIHYHVRPLQNICGQFERR